MLVKKVFPYYNDLQWIFYKNFGGTYMKHVKVVATPKLNQQQQNTGCGECRSSCQSACKTSCTVGNQVCEQKTEVLVKTHN